MHKIEIDEKYIVCNDGALLSDVLRENGIELFLPCGGMGSCGKCAVEVDGKIELACKYHVKKDIFVVLPKKQRTFSAVETVENSYSFKPEFNRRDDTLARESYGEDTCFALDIGTTTLALALVDRSTQKAIKVLTDENPQGSFGADVISRIAYCRKNTPRDLFSVLKTKLERMLETFNFDGEKELYVSGNTVMLHLFLNVDCSDMGIYPYTPAFLASQCVSGETLGLSRISKVITLPCISSFVGADIFAGLCCVRPPQNGKYSLLVDLGTNAEVVLFSAARTLCTAAAAGPCFEGVNITCGMSASSGAICSFKPNPYGEADIKTVGGATARGICGTGLIDAVAALLEQGSIDDSGKLEDDEYYLTENVYLTQEDIRELQLAKSAVCAAVKTLMRLAGAEYDGIDTVYLSGGFSSQLDLSSASRIGLIPPKLAVKCKAMANTSLGGCVRYACERCDPFSFFARAEYVDLSLDEGFSKELVENMSF